MKYRKRPVVIDAFQLGLRESPDWFDEAFKQGIVIPRFTGVVIKTLEGEMTASIGDWIIRGVVGELYPCRADIFEATYEAVGE